MPSSSGWSVCREEGIRCYLAIGLKRLSGTIQIRSLRMLGPALLDKSWIRDVDLDGYVNLPSQSPSAVGDVVILNANAVEHEES